MVIGTTRSYSIMKDLGLVGLFNYTEEVPMIKSIEEVRSVIDVMYPGKATADVGHHMGELMLSIQKSISIYHLQMALKTITEAVDKSDASIVKIFRDVTANADQ